MTDSYGPLDDHGSRTGREGVKGRGQADPDLQAEARSTSSRPAMV
jgi:hypothetical protein